MPLYLCTLLVTGPPDEVERATPLHREHLAELRRRGKLRLAGELAKGEGFVEVYDVEDLHEADATARSSPLVERGLGAWLLRELSTLEVE